MPTDDPFEVAEQILEASEADGTEVLIAARKLALTRFANNAIHQSLDRHDHAVCVRVRVGDRLGEVVGNRVGGDHPARLAAEALEVARAAAPEPELPPLPGPQQYEPVEAFDEKTHAAGPGLRADAVRTVVQRCQRDGLTAAGACEIACSSLAIANSAGLRAFDRRTHASLSLTAAGQDATGWASADALAVADIDPAALAETAAAKAVRGAEPGEFEPGPCTVVLEPDALAMLVRFLAASFNAMSVREGESYLSGREGETITSPLVSLACRPTDPRLQGRPFDGEGIPNRTVPLIEEGRAVGLVCDRATGLRFGIEPNGYGRGGASKEGAWPDSVVMQGGEEAFDELIAPVERGVLVTRIWYTGLVDRRRLVVTGMTRDGTFLIENGRVGRGLRNLRFNVAVPELLSSLEALGPVKRCGDALIPAARLGAFRFTSQTEF
jgi:predicted Zn-dependent protease